MAGGEHHGEEHRDRTDISAGHASRLSAEPGSVLNGYLGFSHHFDGQPLVYERCAGLGTDAVTTRRRDDTTLRKITKSTKSQENLVSHFAGLLPAGGAALRARRQRGESR